LFFMIFHGIEVSIGGLDYGKMKSYCYLKASGFAQNDSRGKTRKKKIFYVWIMCWEEYIANLS
jgi:hypothetical protein